MENVEWGHGTVVPGTPFRTVVDPTQIGGRHVAFAVDRPPGEHVDAHVHDDEDQVHVVVSGTLTCRVGVHLFCVSDGGTVCLPRGVEHELWNETDHTVRMIDLYTPSGIEERFRTFGGREPAHARP
ncbi:MAG: cupin domain-containing protein [Ilumatobacteraceae bacterium]